MQYDEPDITGNIKLIEEFKSNLLSSVAQLYASMTDLKSTTKEKTEILSNIIITAYLLADKLGISYNTLDQKVLNQLKIGILDGQEQGAWTEELSELSRHIDKNRDIIR